MGRCTDPDRVSPDGIPAAKAAAAPTEKRLRDNPRLMENKDRTKKDGMQSEIHRGHGGRFPASSLRVLVKR
jgi:hypothetical protein